RTPVNKPLMQQRHRLGQVNDVDVVARAEDEGGHLRIPAVALVAEVTASLEQLTHIEGGERHGGDVLFRLKLRATRKKTGTLHRQSDRSTGAPDGALGPPCAGPAC